MPRPATLPQSGISVTNEAAEERELISIVQARGPPGTASRDGPFSHATAKIV